MILRDTREQTPWHFPGCPMESATLKTGDYSIRGYTDWIAIERKSHADAWSSYGPDWRRFQRCLERMGAMAERGALVAVVVESTMQGMQAVPTGLRMRPMPWVEKTRTTSGQVMGRVMEGIVRWRVPVYMPGTARACEYLVGGLMSEFWRGRRRYR